MEWLRTWASVLPVTDALCPRPHRGSDLRQCLGTVSFRKGRWERGPAVPWAGVGPARAGGQCGPCAPAPRHRTNHSGDPPGPARPPWSWGWGPTTASFLPSSVPPDGGGRGGRWPEHGASCCPVSPRPARHRVASGPGLRPPGPSDPARGGAGATGPSPGPAGAGPHVTGTAGTSYGRVACLPYLSRDRFTWTMGWVGRGTRLPGTTQRVSQNVRAGSLRVTETEGVGSLDCSSTLGKLEIFHNKNDCACSSPKEFWILKGLQR